MTPISASKLRQISTDIENELERLSQLKIQIKIVREEIDKNPHLADIFYESLTLKLHFLSWLKVLADSLENS
jgi:hypothetical protein